jgi:hypothetical protein
MSLPLVLAMGAGTYTVVHTAIHLYHNITRPRQERMAVRAVEMEHSSRLAADCAVAMNQLEAQGHISPDILERLVPRNMESLGLAAANSEGVSLLSRELVRHLPAEPEFRARFYGALNTQPTSVAQIFAVLSGTDIRKTQVPVRLVGTSEEDIESALRLAKWVSQIGDQKLKLILSAPSPAVQERLKSAESDFVYVSFDRLAKTHWRAENTNFHLMKSEDMDPDTALAVIRSLPVGPDLLELLENLLSMPVRPQDVEIRLKAAQVIVRFA